MARCIRLLWDSKLKASEQQRQLDDVCRILVRRSLVRQSKRLVPTSSSELEEPFGRSELWLPHWFHPRTEVLTIQKASRPWQLLSNKSHGT